MDPEFRWISELATLYDGCSSGQWNKLSPLWSSCPMIPQSCSASSFSNLLTALDQSAWKSQLLLLSCGSCYSGEPGQRPVTKFVDMERPELTPLSRQGWPLPHHAKTNQRNALTGPHLSTVGNVSSHFPPGGGECSRARNGVRTAIMC